MEKCLSFPCTPFAFTVEVGGEAEGVVVLALLVPVAVIAHPHRRVLAAALLPRPGDGVLHRAVLQPARVAPVHALQPGLVQLVVRGQDAVLLQARLLRLVEVQGVAAQARVVGEDHTWGESVEQGWGVWESPWGPPLASNRGGSCIRAVRYGAARCCGAWGNGGARMGPNPGVPAASAHQPKPRGRASRTPKKSFNPFPSTPRMSQPIPTGSGAAAQLRATCGTEAATRSGPPVLYEAVPLSVSAIYELPARKPGATIKANNRCNKTRHTLGKNKRP